MRKSNSHQRPNLDSLVNLNGAPGKLDDYRLPSMPTRYNSCYFFNFGREERGVPYRGSVAKDSLAMDLIEDSPGNRELSNALIESRVALLNRRGSH